MAQINFPSVPTDGQEFTDPNGVTWVYEVNKWRAQLASHVAANIGITDAGGYYTSDNVEGALQETGADTVAAQSTADGAVVDAAAASAAAADASSEAATAQLAATTAQSMANVADGKAVAAAADAAAADANADTRVLKSGDTITGETTIEYGSPIIRLSDPNSTADNRKVRIGVDGQQFRVSLENDSYALKAFPFRIDTQYNVVSMDGAVQVNIPDGTGDGQALAHSQGGAVLNGLDVTTDLNVSKSNGYGTINVRAGNPGYAGLIFRDESNVIRQSFNFNAGDKRTYLTQYDAAGAYKRHIFYVEEDGFMGLGVTSMSVPAPLDGTTNAPAQVTAKDSTTGRLAIGGIEMGDTGWRNMAGDLINGWTAEHIRIRRVGSYITIVTEDLDGSSSTAISLLTMGLSWRGFLNEKFTFRADTGTATSSPNVIGGIVSSGSGTIQVPQATTNGTIRYTYHTSEAWPSSLPGTAA